MRLRRWSTLQLPRDVLPPELRATLRDAWCAVLQVENEYMLIPCFELLRAFYYEAGGAMVDYFASRTPLERICWPIMAPGVNTGFDAHFCVAAQVTHAHQALTGRVAL